MAEILQIECTLCNPPIILNSGIAAERHVINDHTWSLGHLRIKN